MFVRYIGNDPKLAGMEGEIGGMETIDADGYVKVTWNHIAESIRIAAWHLKKIRRYTKR